MCDIRDLLLLLHYYYYYLYFSTTITITLSTSTSTSSSSSSISSTLYDFCGSQTPLNFILWMNTFCIFSYLHIYISIYPVTMCDIRDSLLLLHYYYYYLYFSTTITITLSTFTFSTFSSTLYDFCGSQTPLNFILWMNTFCIFSCLSVDLSIYDYQSIYVPIYD